MLEIIDTTLPVLSELPMLDIQLKDLKVDIIPTDFFLFPEIHLEANLDIQIKL